MGLVPARSEIGLGGGALMFTCAVAATEHRDRKRQPADRSRAELAFPGMAYSSPPVAVVLSIEALMRAWV